MMPTSTLNSLLKSFWLNFEFNFDLQACSTAGEEKAGGFLFCFCFFFWSHTFVVFSSYHNLQIIEGTVRLGNNQIPKANLLEKN